MVAKQKTMSLIINRSRRQANRKSGNQNVGGLQRKSVKAFSRSYALFLVPVALGALLALSAANGMLFFYEIMVCSLILLSLLFLRAGSL